MIQLQFDGAVWVRRLGDVENRSCHNGGGKPLMRCDVVPQKPFGYQNIMIDKDEEVTPAFTDRSVAHVRSTGSAHGNADAPDLGESLLKVRDDARGRVSRAVVGQHHFPARPWVR